MNGFKIGSIVTATLLLVGCGSSGDNSDSTTPSNNETPNVTQSIGKGYYVDAAVAGVNYQCGNQSGTTDVNGTFTFQIGSDCNFTVGGITLRDINASSLENNVTILETNTTVAQLLQTLDSDGNASNGIQVPQGASAIVQETLPSLEDLNQDLLEAVHDRLKSEYSDEYNGTVIDKNQTIEHLNGTKANLEERLIRTNLDVEAEHRGRRDTQREDGNTTDQNSSINIDNNSTIENIIENRDSNNSQEQEHSGRSSSQRENRQNRS